MVAAHGGPQDLGYSPMHGRTAYLSIYDGHNFSRERSRSFDIGCGNKAVLLDVKGMDILGHIPAIMDRVFGEISFGVGQRNKEPVESPDEELWNDTRVDHPRGWPAQGNGSVSARNCWQRQPLCRHFRG